MSDPWTQYGDCLHQAFTPLPTSSQVGIFAATEPGRELVAFLSWVVDVKGYACRYDHHGYCQAHNLDSPCPMQWLYTSDWCQIIDEHEPKADI